jgi:hypothetical protein
MDEFATKIGDVPYFFICLPQGRCGRPGWSRKISYVYGGLSTHVCEFST